MRKKGAIGHGAEIRNDGPKTKTKEAGFRAILETGLTRTLGQAVRVVSVQRKPLESRSTHGIELLIVALENSASLPVIFKQFDGKNEAKGSRREVLIYQRLLAGRRFGAPLLYASLYDKNRRRYWLFLEDVGEWTLNRGEKADWMSAFRWLAELHGYYLGKEKELRSRECLSVHDAGFYRMLARDARRNLQLAGQDRAVKYFDELMTGYDDLIADLLCIPRTLVHGDIFPENLTVQPGHRIRPIDWEGAAIGLAALDVVRLLDGWGSDKGFFIEHYLDTLPRQGAARSAKSEFLKSLEKCELLNELWHLGWEWEACRDELFVDGALQRIKSIQRNLKRRSEAAGRG